MSNSKTESYHFTVDSFSSDKRLDVFLTTVMEGFTRARLQKLIRDGLVKVNSHKAKASLLMHREDKVTVAVPPPTEHDIAAQEIPLNVLYEDEDIIVVDKPAGMVVHPAAGNWAGTLVNALMAYCKDLSGVGGEMKPGIVHRLDKGTSGVMVAAKNDKAHLFLSAQFKDRKVKKVYQALVYGSVKGEEGAIDSSIGRSMKDRKKFSTHTRKGRQALTEWKVLKRFDKDLTLLEIRLRTGRTHQIRVHFAAEGHPLVGDETYARQNRQAKSLSSARRELILSFDRPALHASRIGFEHPKDKKWMEFEAPIPQDFRELLEGIV